MCVRSNPGWSISTHCLPPSVAQFSRVTDNYITFTSIDAESAIAACVFHDYTYCDKYMNHILDKRKFLSIHRCIATFASSPEHFPLTAHVSLTQSRHLTDIEDGPTCTFKSFHFMLGVPLQHSACAFRDYTMINT